MSTNTIISSSCWMMSLSASTFRFARLPPELRLLIWRLTLPLPGIVEVFYNHMTGLPYSFSPIPTALVVCRESRQVALKYFRLLYCEGLGLRIRPIYFQLNVDNLYFSMGHALSTKCTTVPRYLHTLFDGIQKPVLDELRHLTVDLSVYLNYTCSDDWWDNITALLQFDNLRVLCIVAGKRYAGNDNKRQKTTFVTIKGYKEESSEGESGTNGSYECQCCHREHSLQRWHPYMQDSIETDMEGLSKLYVKQQKEKEERLAKELLAKEEAQRQTEDWVSGTAWNYLIEVAMAEYQSIRQAESQEEIEREGYPDPSGYEADADEPNTSWQRSGVIGFSRREGTQKFGNFEQRWDYRHIPLMSPPLTEPRGASPSRDDFPPTSSSIEPLDALTKAPFAAIKLEEAGSSRDPVVKQEPLDQDAPFWASRTAKLLQGDMLMENIPQWDSSYTESDTSPTQSRTGMEERTPLQSSTANKMKTPVERSILKAESPENIMASIEEENKRCGWALDQGWNPKVRGVALELGAAEHLDFLRLAKETMGVGSQKKGAISHG